MSGPVETRPGSRPAGDATARRRRTGERLAALFIVGAVLLNFPLLSVIHGRGPVAGVPALFAYLFLVWAALAGATGLVLRRRPPEADGSGGEPGSREP
jgi:hypothetical protein